MIRLQELRIDTKYKYWFYPLHNRKVKFFTADKNLKKYIKCNVEVIQSHLVKTKIDIDYLFFELEV